MTPFESTGNARSTWNDVTIDLGIGTIVNSLAFNINDWWVTTGIDDIQLDGSPIREDLTTGVQDLKSNLIIIPQHAGVLINNAAVKTNVYIYNPAGILLKQAEINSSTFIELTKGLYVIKAYNSKGSIAKKIMID